MFLTRLFRLSAFPGPWPVLTGLALVLSMGVVGAQNGVTLTNEDVIKMVRAQLASTIIAATIESSNAKFDLSPNGLISLKTAGIPDDLVQTMQTRMTALARGASTDPVSRKGPEKSELLGDSTEPHVILRTFKTMLVDASRAVYFGTPQMKAALARNKGFAPLKISVVDDPSVADVVLNVSYTFAWDYPFTLKHQNTSMVLMSGKGTGPFSGPAGAGSVASEVVKALRAFRDPKS